ncbi:MAG: hypothetical protein IT159_13185 [Bryobacterales bacterium]|nr:hypothetical protein [Bryobacterales bacterium]
MTWNWLLQFAVNGVLTGAGWLLCLYLFFSFKRELLRERGCAGDRYAAVEQELEALRTSLGRLEASLSETSRKADLLIQPPPAASGLNITKRSQALRMHRRGETPENIAAALGMPQLEVALLLKVEQIGAGKA